MMKPLVRADKRGGGGGREAGARAQAKAMLALWALPGWHAPCVGRTQGHAPTSRPAHCSCAPTPLVSSIVTAGCQGGAAPRQRGGREGRVEGLTCSRKQISSPCLGVPARTRGHRTANPTAHRSHHIMHKTDAHHVGAVGWPGYALFLEGGRRPHEYPPPPPSPAHNAISIHKLGTATHRPLGS
jgi:hypothetical protein